MADERQVLPLLLHAVDHGVLSASEIGMEPEDLCSRAARVRSAQAARVALWTATAARVLPRVRECIVLKGAPLGARLAGDPLARQTGDLDLWLPTECVSDAVAALGKIGYGVAVPVREWATNQIMLVHPTLFPVELHWALAPPPWRAPAYRDAAVRAQTLDWRGIPMRVLGDADLCVHLILHAHQHYFALKTCLDTALATGVIAADGALLRSLGLCRLDRLVHAMACAFDGGEPASRCEAAVRAAWRMWLRGMLCDTRRGNLVFGQDSAVAAATGVLLRAASMVLLDDGRVCAAARVILGGPHRLGAFLHGLGGRGGSGVASQSRDARSARLYFGEVAARGDTSPRQKNYSR